jgi:glycosyltransferase involved in cell wall biosynthesis
VTVLMEYAEVDGGTKVAIDLLTEWAALGVERRVIILASGNEQMLSELDALGPVEVLDVPRLRTRLSSLRGILARGPDRGPGDVVFAIGDYCGLLATAAAMTLTPSRRPAVVIGEHQPRPLREAIGSGRGAALAALFAPVERQLRRRVAGSIFTSATQANEAGSSAAARHSVAIPNPTRVPLADIVTIEARVQRLRLAGRVGLINVGSLNAQKDHRSLLEAASLLDGQFDLTIVGGGSPDELDRGAIELGISDRVTLTGALEDVARALDEQDVFVLSSRWETAYPLVVIEAIARGLPVVATTCSPSMAALASRIPTIRLTRVGEPQELADAIRATVEDPPSADTLHAAARELLEAHDPRVAAEQHLRFFARALVS